MNEFINKTNIYDLNGSDLAYIGDAYFELWIRMYLISSGYKKPGDLHNLGLNYVSASSHAYIVKQIYDKLSNDEIDIFKRGRNYNYKHRPKNTKISEYLMSSGFEAVIGYLYITKNNLRLEELLQLSAKVIEERNE